MCTDQPYLFTETGFLSSLDSHYQHNIIYVTLKFQIPSSPAYKRKIWDYKSAKMELIRNELRIKSLVFSDRLVGIFSKFIPN